MTSGGDELEGVDRGIAIFFVVFAVVFILIGVVSTALFFRERKAFEIRARSAYLVMLTGLSFLAVICKILVNHVEGVFGVHKDVYVAKTIKYFAIVCSTCCYGSRTIRLALLYSPRARKTAPWLLPERNHVVVCILLGVAAMIAPLHYMATHNAASSDDAVANAEREEAFVSTADDQLWAISLTCKILVIALNPLTWVVDDIFNLGRELRVMAVVLLVQIVVGKVVDGMSLKVQRWIDNENLDFTGAVIMFSLSVIHPIKERLLHPMQSSDPKVAEALLKRKGNVYRLARIGKQVQAFSRKGRSSRSRNDSDGVASASGPIEEDDTNTVGIASIASANTSPGSWTYERVVAMPEVSAAFEEFSRKALCQESIFFLKDAFAYQSRGFADDDPCEGTDNKAGGGDEEEKARGREESDAVQKERFSFLSRIVRDYIADGAPNEINISSRDKRSIIDIYKLGEGGFRELPAETQRGVFTKAYSEIRFMLESNLMRKFLSTDGFKDALATDRANKSYLEQA